MERPQLPNRPPYALPPEDVARLPEVRSTEEHRHQCEVRLMLEARARDGDWSWVQRFFSMVEKKRGKEARDRLADSTRDQWTKGNRGRHGDWR